MLAFGDVRKWDADWLHENVGLLNARCNELVGLSDEVSDAGKTSRWHGEAAQAAGDNLTSVRGGLEDLISEIAAMRTAMGEAADAVSGLLHGVAEAESLAGRYYLRIEDNGSLTDTADFSFPSEEQKNAWESDRNRIKAELGDRVKEILRRAEDIDNDLSSVISKCLDVGGVGDPAYDSLTEAARAGGEAGHLSMLEPPPGGTVAANAAWFSTLGEGEKAWILANRPDLIGNLDGVPADYRDLANRARIPGERARLQAERDKLAAEIRDLQPPSNRAEMYKIAEIQRKLDPVKAKLNSLNKIEEMLTLPDRHLLALDTGGDRAKAAIANGNVDTADHVAVFTPGVNSTVDGSMKGYDSDMNELREKTRTELKDVGRGGESVAVVTWLNYEPPNMDQGEGPAAVQDGRAYEGAARLAPFLEGINASRPDDPHLTALGHSYGSLTTGIALRDHATGVDEMVVFGSPGLEVHNASELQVPQGHAYNMQADGDWLVADAGSIFLGPDVSDVPGIRQLSTDAYTAPDGRHFEASSGHSEYNRAGDKDTTSEWNMANIIAGTGIYH